MELDDANYRMKPMNCPFHILIYKNSPKSYRDLPVRYAELGNVYRYERSGTMHGLMRVRGFPLWLAPIQVDLVPISERHATYAAKVETELKSAGLRVEVDLRNEKMNAKIRDFANQKTPYILVFGDKEEAANSVSVRARAKGDQGPMSVTEFIAMASVLIARRLPES
jgi:threonyl-tRNA synthetase